MPHLENKVLSRRAAIQLGAAGLATIPACYSKDTTSDIQETLHTEAQAPELSEIDWEYVEYGLKDAGCTVHWNEATNSDARKKIIIPNTHVLSTEKGATPAKRKALIGEYRALEACVGSGLRSFALEGSPSNTPYPVGSFISVPNAIGLHKPVFFGHNLDWREYISNPEAFVMSPEHIRNYFSDDQNFLRFLDTDESVGNISAALFVAAYSDTPDINIIGAEDPETYPNLIESIQSGEKYEKVLQRLQSFQSVPEVRKEDGTFRYKFGTDAAGNPTHFGLFGPNNQPYNAEAVFYLPELENSILHTLGLHPDIKKRDYARNRYTANILDADVIHMGNGHLHDYYTMEDNTSSLGIAIPEETSKLDAPLLEDPLESTKHGQFYLWLQEVKKLQ